MSPLKSEPFYVVKNILYIFRVFLGRVCIIKTEIADATIFLSDAKIHADGLSVTDMQIAIRLRRKTCLNASSVLSLGEIFLYQLLYETQ